MRGKLLLLLFYTPMLRITPAHAGKTFDKYGKNGHVEDHPRACGENVEVVEFDSLGEGSPPRMRGKLSEQAPSVNILRITPAHAGKTKQ